MRMLYLVLFLPTLAMAANQDCGAPGFVGNERVVSGDRLSPAMEKAIAFIQNESELHMPEVQMTRQTLNDEEFRNERVLVVAQASSEHADAVLQQIDHADGISVECVVRR